jgi:hypothetical protein
MVLYEGSEPYTDPKYPQEWPDQKLPLEDLLHKKSEDLNPLARRWVDKNNMIQWFHLPSNNMEWVEVCRSASSLDALILTSDNRKPCLGTMARRNQTLMALIASQGLDHRHAISYAENIGVVNSREAIWIPLMLGI